jgi:hypothetical protein
MNTIIASMKVWVAHEGQPPFEVTLQIGTPYQKPDDPEMWACPVSLQPLYKNLSEARSDCAFQALCLASSLVLDLLHGVKEQGGTVQLSPGEDFPFEAYAFGVAARAEKPGA